jgi:hypothetical protein
MKVYFIASSRLVGKEPGLYGDMYKLISSNYKMVSNRVLQWSKMGAEEIAKMVLEKRRENYEEAVKDIKKADLVVMEVSGHSMSMGYLMRLSLDFCKPVVALYQEPHPPVFIQGVSDPKLLIRGYKRDSWEEIVNESIKKAESLIDVRFNFFVPPKILAYLDWVSQKKMVPRSVFLRNLIEKQIRKDKEFKG